MDSVSARYMFVFRVRFRPEINLAMFIDGVAFALRELRAKQFEPVYLGES